MKLVRTALAATVMGAAFGLTVAAQSAPANSDQDIRVEATKTSSIPGHGVLYSGKVRITPPAGTHLTVQSTPNGLLVTRETPGDNFVGNVSFDVATQVVDIAANTVTFHDGSGNVLTIVNNSPLPPGARPGWPAQATSQQAAPSQSQPADDQPEPKRPRRMDPVTDRGFVIP